MSGMVVWRAGKLTATRRGRWLAASVVLLLVALVVAACGSVTDSSPTAVRVARGSETRTVSETGTLQAITEQSLGFLTSGKLVALLVTVGQRVNAGQVLARVDDFEAQVALRQAQAKLHREQARLAKIRDGKESDAAADDYEGAKDVFQATKDESDTVDRANGDAIEEAQKRLDSDQDSLKQAQAQVHADQARCDRSGTSGLPRYDNYDGVKSKDERGPLDVHSPSCGRAARGKAAVASYQRRCQRDRVELERAQRRASVDHTQQWDAVDNARRDATAAGNRADSTASGHQHHLEEQAMVVSEAEAAVRRAQQDVDGTVLKAPVTGKVASINGTVGEYLGAGLSLLTSRGRAPLRNIASGTGWSKNSTESKSERLGGGFITLEDVNSYQVVTLYQTADIAQVILPNQKVEVSFDAVPGLTLVGTVVSIVPAGTQVQDVTNYRVSVVLNELDPRLKSGLSAKTKIAMGGADNVLVVPPTAVQRAGKPG